MKNNLNNLRKTTNPILLNAIPLMSAYEKATGAKICIHDQNCLPINELSGEIPNERNMCVFCHKYQNNVDVKNINDLADNPCSGTHVNALKESHRFGGSYTYVCPLGFIFWTSPVFQNKKFAGAILGSGFRGNGSGETGDRMRGMCGDKVSDDDIKKMPNHFPRATPEKTKALAELLRICTQSLSVRSEGCHAAMRRRAEQQAELSAKVEDMKSEYPPGSPRPEYPLEKEQKLLEAIRQGDAESCGKILNEILAVLFFTGAEQFRDLQFRAIELTVMLSRVDGRFITKTIMETNYLHVKTILETTSIEELTDVLHRITDDLAGQARSFRGIQHASAIKKAEHFILENFKRKISLEEIAGASGFSAPYFSTIFKEEMGENLSSYLNRLRVEKASYMLTDTNLSLSKIARACGFEDQSWFSKIFKHFTGISPGKFRSRKEKTP